jgi:hypothetical protein
MSWFRRSPKPQSDPQSPPTAPANSAPQAPHPVASQQPVVAPPVTFTPTGGAFATTMMDYPLTLQHVYDRGRRLFPHTEIVSLTAEGAERTTFGETFARVERLAAALDGLGVRRGDRARLELHPPL